MRKKYNKNLILLQFFLLFTLFINVSLADDNINNNINNSINNNDEKGLVVFCTADMPCDKDGNVLRKYLESDCLETYQRRCLNYKLQELSKEACKCKERLKKRNERNKRKDSVIKEKNKKIREKNREIRELKKRLRLSKRR